MCDLRLKYCTKSEKGNLLKLVSEVFIFRKKVLKEKFFDGPQFFFEGHVKQRYFFSGLREGMFIRIC